MNMKKVRCISERKSMPGQIKVGHEYWADVDSTMKDEDGDRYYQIYLDKDAMYSVGNLLTSHFEEIFETVEGSYHMPAGKIFSGTIIKDNNELVPYNFSNVIAETAEEATTKMLDFVAKEAYWEDDNLSDADKIFRLSYRDVKEVQPNKEKEKYVPKHTLNDVIGSLELCINNIGINEDITYCEACPYSQYARNAEANINTNCDVELMKDVLYYLKNRY